MSDYKSWLEQRRKGIGGSDVAAIMGLNPWKSPIQVWNEKISKDIKIDPSEELIFRLGHFLEPMIADEYYRMTGRKLEERPLKIHPKYHFMIGNIDREIIGDVKGPGILEIKTKGAYSSWHGDIPIYYMLQLQHYLELYDYDWGSFAILDLGTRNIRYLDVEKDNNIIDYIIEKEKYFWSFVENKIPPEIDDTKSCEKFLRNYYYKSEPITIDLIENEEANLWIKQLKYVRYEYDALSRFEAEAKNNLMSIMGIAEKGIGKGFTIRWKSPKDREVFDLNRFKIDYPDLAKKYLRHEPQTRRFNVYWKKSIE